MHGRWPHPLASLRTRLMALALAALLPGFLVIGFTEWQIDASRRAEVRETAQRSARQAAFEVERLVSGVQAVLIAVSETHDIRTSDGAGCGTYLSDLAPRLPNLSGIALIDMQGNFRCGSMATAPAVPVSYRDRPYFNAALASTEPVIGEFSVAKVTGRPALPIALAIRDPAGTALGVLVAGLDLNWLSEKLKERGLPPEGSVTVADRNGIVIARQPLPDQFIGTKIPAGYMRLVHGTAAGVEAVISQDGTPRVLGYVPVSVPPVGLYVSTGLSMEVSYGTVSRAARLGALLAGLTGLATLAAAWFVGNRVFVQPLQTLKRVLDRWRGGDSGARTGYSAAEGEIGDLGAALDAMMDEIAETQEQRALLARELSHRIKNTLATVQAIALSTLRKPEPGRDLLPGFVARIAALARTHEVLTRERWEKAELRALATAVAGPLCGDVEARFRFDGPAVDLPEREALGMTMVLHELCTNAVKYGALSTLQGQVSLRWTLLDGKLDLVWREAGGPPVTAPATATGFGTRLISRAFGSTGSAHLAFEPHGLVCRITLQITPADRAQR